MSNGLDLYQFAHIVLFAYMYIYIYVIIAPSGTLGSGKEHHVAATAMMPTGDYVVVIDFNNGYHHPPFKPSFRRYSASLGSMYQTDGNSRHEDSVSGQHLAHLCSHPESWFGTVAHRACDVQTT